MRLISPTTCHICVRPALTLGYINPPPCNGHLLLVQAVAHSWGLADLVAWCLIRGVEVGLGEVVEEWQEVRSRE